MVGQARIVLYPWLGDAAPTVNDPTPLLPLVTTSTPSQGTDVVAWPRGRTALAGWRMIGGNNRELGRGVRPLASVVEAYRFIHEAKLAFGRPEVRVMLDAVAGWSWHISLNGEPVAVSRRGYQRQRECEYSLEQFRQHFPTSKLVMPTALKPRARRRSSPILPTLANTSALPTTPGVESPWTVVAGPTPEVVT